MKYILITFLSLVEILVNTEITDPYKLNHI